MSKIAVTIGTTSYRLAETLAGNEVEFVGTWVFAADGIMSLMVWDSGLNNARAMTQAEIDALPAQNATKYAQAEKAAATQGVDDGVLQHGNRVERIAVCAALVALDAANAERTCFAAMNTAVQGAASLAALKTAFAAISFPPQVTAAQLATAIKNKIAATAE